MNELDIFTIALELTDPVERTRYLDEACHARPELRERIEALLRNAAQSSRFLESPAAGPAPTVDQPPLEKPGTQIGPYKLLQEIGQGGMGVVYMAEQREPVERRVALKIIKPGMDTQQVIARFQAEEQALAMMDHPNIAKVLDAGVTDTGRPYFVMELVKGIPITQYSDEHQLTPRQRLELFVPVCHAVQHAHQKGIIHRDIKPSNVLVAEYDDRPVPKIIDFGVAKAIQQRLTERTVFTQLGQVVGTIDYMSPEQAKLNQLDIDTRTDVYSLGVLLYELLTGETPLDRQRLRSAAFDEMLRIIREEEPPRPSHRLSSSQSLPSIAANRHTEPKKLSTLIRGELDWIAMKALEKDRTRRYETANALASDVEHYLADEPVVACPPSAAYRFRKFARRNKAGLAVVGLVLFFLILLGAGVGWVVRDREARQEETAQQARESLNQARRWVRENRLALARQELAAAKARMDTALPAMGELAHEIQVLQTEIDRYDRFFGLIEQAREAEFPQPIELVVDGDSPDDSGATPPQPSNPVRERGKAVPFLLHALSCYGVLDRDDWIARLEGGSLAPDQVAQVRRTIYEELLWLADDVARRQADHRSGRKMSPREVAEEGLAYLKRAERAASVTSGFYQIRARLLTTAGKQAEVGQDEQLARQSPPLIALDHYLLACAAYDAQNMAEAIKHYEAALRIEPAHYWSLLLLGTCLSDKDRPDQDFASAAGVFTGCILHRADQARPYLGRGYAYARLKRSTEAEADIRQAVRLRPDYADAHRYLGWILIAQRKFAEAEPEFREAIRLQPGLYKDHYNLGFALHHQGKFGEAEREFREAARLRPDFYFGPHWAALAMGEQGKYAAAVQYYVERSAADPKFADSFNGLNRNNAACAAAKAGCGQGDGAELDDAERARLRRQALDWLRANVQAWRQALEKDPVQARPHMERPAKWLQDRAFDGVRGDALAKQPEEEQKAWRQLWADADQFVKKVKSPYGGWPASELKRRLDDLSKLLDSNPRDAGLLEQRAGLYAYLGRYDEAALDFVRARELSASPGWDATSALFASWIEHDKVFARIAELLPDDPGIWITRAQVFQQLGDTARAEADLSKAVQLAPGDPLLWTQRALCYARRDELDKADADVARAASLRPTPGSELGFAETRTALGRLYWDRDRRPEAHRLWQDVLRDLHELAVENQEDRQLQQRLGSCEREICHHYGAMGLWDLAATYAKHNAALRRITDFNYDLGLEVMLAATGEGEAWSAYCRHAETELRAKGPLKQNQVSEKHWNLLNLVRTACLLDPPAIDAAAWLAPARNWPPGHCWRELTLGFLLCRTGQYDEALKEIESNPASKNPDASTRDVLEPLSEFLLAITAHRSRQRESALPRLERAEQRYQQIARAALAPDQTELPGGFGRFWWEVPGIQVLRREAWQKIKGEPPPDDPWWHLIQARGYGLLGESERAEKEFAAAAVAAPNDPDFEQARARVSESLARAARAESDRKKTGESTAGMKKAVPEKFPQGFAEDNESRKKGKL